MRILLFLISLICFSKVHAQDHSFKVFYFEGSIMYKPFNTGKWKKLDKPGINLGLYDSLNINESGSLHLTSEKSGQIYINTPGKNRLQEIAEQASNQEGNYLLFEYIDFLVEEMSKPKKNLETYADEYLHAKGVVTRAVNIPPVLLPFSDELITDSLIVFKWEDINTDFYTFYIWDGNKNPNMIYYTKTTDTTIIVPAYSDFLNGNTTFYWTVCDKNKPANTYLPFHLADDSLSSNINAHVQKNKKHDAVSLIYLAGYFEKYRAYSRAYSTYQKALKMYPGNEIVQNYYDLFLARRGIY
jgi:hypothetical protein